MPALTHAEAQARAALVDLKSYQVSLDLTADPPRSRTEVAFRCRQAGSATFADLDVPAVHSVSLNGTPIDPPADGRLTLPDLAEANLLIVEAELGYRNDGRGLIRNGDDTGDYVYAFAYPVNAPDIFCCFDQPDMTGTLRLDVTVPAGWECFANTPAQQRPAAGAAGTWRFEPLPGLVAYDFALCAGPYARAWSGGRVAVYCRGSLAQAPVTGRLAAFGELTRKALAEHEARLGVDFPSQKYDIMFVPYLAVRALSVPGQMMVNEDLLDRLADPNDDFMTMLAAHEAAHQWFTGMVPWRWWDDLWIDEAIATFLSYTGIQDWTAFCYRSKAEAYRADELPSREPIAPRVPSLAEAFNRQHGIVYVKGAAVMRQLAALIGMPALDKGLHDYLVMSRGGVAGTDDMFGCLSRAADRDLSGWADDWLRSVGTPTLRPELTLAPDGTIAAFAISQDLPRTQRVKIGLFDRDGDRLRRRGEAGAVSVELSGNSTEVPELAGQPVPDALILNDEDLAVARITLDPRTFAALADAAMELGDPLTEAVCWNAAWQQVRDGELAAAGFGTLVARRIARGALLVAGVESLIERALLAADTYAPPSSRAAIRSALASAIIASERGATTPPVRRALALAFATSAQSAEQLAELRTRLAVADNDATLRAAMVRTLAARGLASDADIDALAAADPAAAGANRARCTAMRPDPAAKAAAWSAALDEQASMAVARAHAEGFWVPGQDDLLTGYRERYFEQALPCLDERAKRLLSSSRAVTRIAKALYPAMLADEATLAATRAALADDKLCHPLRQMLLEREATTRSARSARLNAVS